jgi:hypothetical protein
VVQTLSVESKTEQALVPVLKITLATHMKDVDQNVFSTLIVPPTKLVLGTNAKILVLEHAVKMLNVKL